MDLSTTIQAKSDQLNADDLLGGPQTFTIETVTPGTDEQPVHIGLTGLAGRSYKPSKSMRRVLVAAWGPDGSTYAGRQLTLYRNPDLTFGKEKVGGIEISHMSHIDKDVVVNLMVGRNKRRAFRVQPLPTQATQPSPGWDALVQAGAGRGMTPQDVAAIASEHLGKELQGPQDIPADQYPALMALITTGETQPDRYE